MIDADCSVCFALANYRDLTAADDTIEVGLAVVPERCRNWVIGFALARLEYGPSATGR